MSIDPVAYAREVLAAEAKAVESLQALVGESFARAARAVLECPGKVVVTGMGKPGLVGAKISATLASTGTPSLSLHPAEAIHGDLGRVGRSDVVLVLSNSGETEEIVKLLPALRKIGARIIGVTGGVESTLARHSDVVLNIGRIDEACPNGLAPTASTTAMLAIGDALAMTVARLRNFSVEDYAFFHPGGSLGRKLMKVDEIMRRGVELTVVPETATVRETMIRMNHTPRRPGAACIVDKVESAVLVGIFTDGDLARHVEKQSALDGKVSDVMCRSPKTVPSGALASDALKLLRDNKIDQVPVVASGGRLVGLVDVQDLLATGVV